MPPQTPADLIAAALFVLLCLVPPVLAVVMFAWLDGSDDA